MSRYDEVKSNLLKNRSTWLITGVAGFIGSNLLETLLKLDRPWWGWITLPRVISTTSMKCSPLLARSSGAGSVSLKEISAHSKHAGEACSGVDYVLHQAALGSVPRSIEDPITTNENNISGFLNMLVAARDAKVKRFVYAASSSTYGDHPELPKVEDKIGKPLSPYAVTKLVNELYAEVFARTYDFKTIGLRYFNIFGARQDPDGAYAAVIPKWTAAMINNEPVWINGDGETSRDFCFIDNAVQANLLAATASDEASGQVYNVAVSGRTSLNKLFS